MADAARELVKKADKKVKGGFFDKLLLGSSRFDDACELYQQAANQFKLAKEWREGADALMKCSFCQGQLQSKSDEANFIIEAANLMKRYSTEDAVLHYGKAVDILSASGRFSQSAKLLKTVGELLEEQGDNSGACDAYRRAADLFEMDEFGKSQYTACILKVAEIGSRNGDYPEAIKIYEKEGEKALQSSMLQFGAKDHFIRAGILSLLHDDVTARVALDRYETLDPRFSSSLEGQLLRKIVEAFSQGETEAFVEAVTEYDGMKKLDSWKVHFLNKIKSRLPAEEGAPPSAAEVEGSLI